MAFNPALSSPTAMGPIDIEDSPPASPVQLAPPPVSPLHPGPLALPDTTEPVLPSRAGPSPVNGTLLNGGTGSDDDILIVKCGGCAASNILTLPKDCWYVVFRGIGVGVQRSSEVAEYMTKGIKNSSFKRYKTRQIAEEVFEQAKSRGQIEYLIR